MPRARRRLLFLSQCLPFPPTSGVTNRTYHIVRELQRTFDVSLVAFSRLNHQPDAIARMAARNALAEELDWVAEAVPVRSEASAIARVGVHLGSLLTGRCYVDLEYASRAFGERMSDAMRQAAPDLVHIDSLDLHRWVGGLREVPVACTHHSIESDLLRLRASHHKSRVMRPYLTMQAARYEDLERRLTPGFAINVMMSDVDAARLGAIAPGARTVTVPNGVDPAILKPGNEAKVDPDLVAFLGPAYMYPNRDGMEFFLAHVWPRILRARPTARLEWIGRMSNGDRMQFERHPRVRCVGFVPDLGQALATPACMIVPLRIGGGTRLKILDAWAAGKAVVSTAVGCEGLETSDGTNIVIRDEPAEFASSVVELLGSDTRRAVIGAAARRTAESTYSWARIGEDLSKVYLGLI